MGERFSFPSGSRRSPAAKRYLVNVMLKISPLVATTIFPWNKKVNFVPPGISVTHFASPGVPLDATALRVFCVGRNSWISERRRGARLFEKRRACLSLSQVGVVGVGLSRQACERRSLSIQITCIIVSLSLSLSLAGRQRLLCALLHGAPIYWEDGGQLFTCMRTDCLPAAALRFGWHLKLNGVVLYTAWPCLRDDDRELIPRRRQSDHCKPVAVDRVVRLPSVVVERAARRYK